MIILFGCESEVNISNLKENQNATVSQSDYFLCNGGGVLGSTDYRRIPANCDDLKKPYLGAFFISDDNTIYTYSQAVVSVSTDAGLTFKTLINSALSGYLEYATLWSVPPRHIYVDSSKNIFLSVYGKGLLVSLDNGQSFSLKTLVNHNIRSISKDSSGNLIVGTDQGMSISSDNGNTFINKNSSDGLPANRVNGVAFNSSNHYYIATSGGLAISTDAGATFTNKTTADGLISNNLTSIFVDPSNNAYMGSASGLSITSDGGISFRSKTTAHGLSDNNVAQIIGDSSGNIYVTAGSLGMSVSNDSGTSFTAKTTADGLLSNSVKSLALNSTNNLFTWCEGGISTSSNAGSTFSNLITVTDLEVLQFNQTGANLGRAWNTHVTAAGNIYIGTKTEGYYYSTNGGLTWSNVNTADGIENNDIRSVYADDSGKLYIGTFTGLSISTNGGATFTTKTTADGLGSNKVNDIYVDSSGNIYASTEDGLSISTNGGASFLTTNYLNGLGSMTKRRVYTIVKDSVGNIFAATNGGLGISTDGGSTFTTKTTVDGLSHINVYSLAIDPTDNLYIGTNSFTEFDVSTDGGASFTNLPVNAFGGVKSILYKSDTLYLGTQAGLWVSTDNGTTLTKAFSTEVFEFHSIHADSSNNIFVLAQSGLLVNPSSF